MPLYTYLGQLLSVSGALATTQSCCCGSSTTSSSRPSSSTTSGDSSGDSGSKASCPSEPSCPSCYAAFPAGFDGNCITYECYYVVGPFCPPLPSSASYYCKEPCTDDTDCEYGSYCTRYIEPICPDDFVQGELATGEDPYNDAIKCYKTVEQLPGGGCPDGYELAESGIRNQKCVQIEDPVCPRINDGAGDFAINGELLGDGRCFYSKKYDTYAQCDSSCVGEFGGNAVCARLPGYCCNNCCQNEPCKPPPQSSSSSAESRQFSSSSYSKDPGGWICESSSSVVPPRSSSSSRLPSERASSSSSSPLPSERASSSSVFSSARASSSSRLTSSATSCRINNDCCYCIYDATFAGGCPAGWREESNNGTNWLCRLHTPVPCGVNLDEICPPRSFDGQLEPLDVPGGVDIGKCCSGECRPPYKSCCVEGTQCAPPLVSDCVLDPAFGVCKQTFTYFQCISGECVVSGTETIICECPCTDDSQCGNPDIGCCEGKCVPKIPGWQFHGFGSAEECYAAPGFEPAVCDAPYCPNPFAPAADSIKPPSVGG